jgi:predicted GIY-YIG superfamily endonuclease
MTETPFAVGSRITWLDHLSDLYVYEDGEEKVLAGAHRLSCSGIIKRLTPYTVVIFVEEGRGQGTEQRFDKVYLADRVDGELREVILASMATPGPASKTDTTCYSAYTLKDPRDQAIHYVGISKNIEQRFKQHLQCEGLNLEKNLWIQELLRSHKKPVLTVLETVSGRRAALEREQAWIRHYAAQGHPLENIQGHLEVLSVRAEQAALTERGRSRFAHLPQYEAAQLTELTLHGYERYGYDAWDMAYDFVRTTVREMEKLPGVNVRMSEIELAKFTFHIYDTPIVNLRIMIAEFWEFCC